VTRKNFGKGGGRYRKKCDVKQILTQYLYGTLVKLSENKAARTQIERRMKGGV